MFPDTNLKYYLRLRLINLAGVAANVYYGDGVDVYNERIANEMIEEIIPKIHVRGQVPANYTITATAMDTNTPLFINGYTEIIAEPTRERIDYNLYIVKSKGQLIVPFILLLRLYVKKFRLLVYLKHLVTVDQINRDSFPA